jgi:hypothetical protein
MTLERENIQKHHIWEQVDFPGNDDEESNEF